MAEGNSQFDHLLDKVTTSASADPDWSLIIEICDLILQKHCDLPYAFAEIKKKINHSNKNVAALATHVLDSVVGNCGSLLPPEDSPDSGVSTTDTDGLPNYDSVQRQRQPQNDRRLKTYDEVEEEDAELQLALAISKSEADAEAKRTQTGSPEVSLIQFDSDSESSGPSSSSASASASIAPKKTLAFTQSKECIVCREKRTLFYSCDHMCMCFQCATTQGQVSCPICHAEGVKPETTADPTAKDVYY